MKKILILVSLCLLSFGTFAFASNDCSLVENELKKNEKDIMINEYVDFSELYPKEAFNKALMNLKAYCCDKPDFVLEFQETCKGDEDYFSNYYPESDYLYDHLIDIALRRLDAVEEKVYGIASDPIGIEWRNYISKEVGETDDPGFALAMDKQYKKYRDVNSEEGPAYNPIALTWVGKMSTGDIFAWSKQYKNANLYDRYVESCGIAAQVYLYYTSDKNTDSKSMIKSSAFESCKKIVNKRIAEEVLYTKAQMSDKSSKLLNKSVESYLTNYFAKNRLINLQETVLLISDLFVSIAKMVPEGTRECH